MAGLVGRRNVHGLYRAFEAVYDRGQENGSGAPRVADVMKEMLAKAPPLSREDKRR